MALAIYTVILLTIGLQLGGAGPAPHLRPLSIKQVEDLNNFVEDGKHNMWEMSGQYEGDMVLLPGQRVGLIDTSLHWPNLEVPYELASDVTPEEEAWIKETLEDYTNYTCITFRERTEEDQDYVYVTLAFGGCWSYVGRRGGEQQLNLQRVAAGIGFGCLTRGTILHEFLHVLGVYHEHSAPNRDEYITINWNNIMEGSESNFDKRGEKYVSLFGQPYDYGSVMHYGAYAFAVDDSIPTIIPIQDPDAELGQRLGFSQIDINKLNIMYGCEKR